MTIANDSIKSSGLPKNSRNRFNRIFNNEKRNLTYPATLIGRLGVNADFQGMHIGHQLMQYIKDQNIAQDNDIERAALKRYDEDGNLIYEVTTDEPLLTCMMYFDLKKL